MTAGQHPRAGAHSPLSELEADLVRTIYEKSEMRGQMMLDCGGPAPGCSLYGFQFDLQMARSSAAAAVAVTALQVSAAYI